MPATAIVADRLECVLPLTRVLSHETDELTTGKLQHTAFTKLQTGDFGDLVGERPGLALIV
jgi:hypothetical protein